ncbi:MAG: hypothetical protein K2Y21_04630 [Phycisphaerales bacterium]|nr:hypothetical protein [Phycisphaerales bacterium]
MNGDDHEEAQALPAAAHRPIRVVLPLRHRSLSEQATVTDHVVGYGAYLTIAVCLLVVPIGEAVGAVLMPLALGVIVYMNFSGSRRLLRETRSEFDRLRTDRFMACPDCAYDLRGCPTEGHCPECGEAYDPEFLEATWTCSYKVHAKMHDLPESCLELRDINEEREERLGSYQNTNKSVDSTFPTLPPG